MTIASSHTKVVKIEDGKIVVVGNGTALVTVNYAGNDKYEAANSKVIEVNVTLIEISIDVEDKVDMNVGDSVNVNATLTPADAGNVTYASSNSSVVTVDAKGNVKAVAAGNANITVSFAGDDMYAASNATVAVSVSKIETSIDVEDKVDMNVGDSVNVNATLTPAEAGELDYTSSDVSVVEVNGIGELTAVGDGSAVITVSFYGDDKYAASSKNVTVTVSPSKIETSIDVEESVDMKVGENVKLNATLTPAEAGELDYTSSDVSVVEVNGIGELTAVGDGSAVITVSFPGDDKYFASSKNVTVTVSLNDASVSADDIALNVGDNATIAAVTTPEGLNITYTPDNSGVVDVEDGVVTALKEGTANIILTVGGDGVYAKNSTTITVTVNKISTAISVNDKADMKVGDSVNVNATLSPADAGELVYVSSDVSVVTVDAKGNVKAVGAGNANITVSFAGDDKYAAAESKNITVTVSKVSTKIDASDVTAVYNVEKDLVITLKDANGKPIAGVNITVDLNGKNTYTTDKNGQVTVSTKGLDINSYTAKITFNGNSKYAKSTKNVKVTVKKATPKLTAKAKTFKVTTKTKKYVIILKNNLNKPISKATVYLKVAGKTYKAITNSKGKATFKITKLSKKGTYKATVTFKGNAYYNKVSKKVNIKVKTAWKTVSKGSKKTTTVKKIQRALKNNGYYLSYNGHYLKVDGIYHIYTEMAVKQFQKSKGLKVTGKVDEKTAIKLKLI